MQSSSLWWLYLLFILLLASQVSASILLVNQTGYLNETEIIQKTSISNGPDQALFYTSSCKSCVISLAEVVNVSRSTGCFIQKYDVSTPENFSIFHQYQEGFSVGSLGMPVLIAGDLAIGRNIDIHQYAQDDLSHPSPAPMPAEPNIFSQIILGCMYPGS